MGVVKNIMVRAVADFSGLIGAANQAKSKMKETADSVNQSTKKMRDQSTKNISGLESALMGIGGKLAGLAGMYFGIQGMGQALSDATKFDAMMTTLNDRLGASSQGFQAWADSTGKAMGYSKLQIAEYGNTYSNMLMDAASSQEDLARRTEKMLEASAVVRSKMGLSQEEVSRRIRSAMNQEADGADELGINVRTSAVETSKAYKEMANGAPFASLSTGMQKAIMSQYILDEVTRKYGNTLADNAATRTALFTASLKDLRLSLGQAFLPIVYVALPYLTALVGHIDVALQKVGFFMRVLFGIKTPDNSGTTKKMTAAIGGQANAVNGLADSHKKLAKAKKESNNLAGFDQINSLSTPSADASANDGSGGGGGGGVPTGGVPSADPNTPPDSGGLIDESKKKIEDFANGLRDAFTKLRTFISDNSAVILSIVGGLVAGIATFFIATNWTAIVAGLTTAFEVLGAALGVVSIPMLAVAAVVALLVGNLLYLWQTNENFRESVKSVWNEIKTVVTQISNDMWTSVKGTWDQYGKGIVDGFGQAMNSIQQILLSLWNDFIQPVLMDGIKYVKKLWDEHLKGLFDQVSEFVGKLITVGLLIWNKFLAPIILYLVEKLAPIWKKIWDDIMLRVSSIIGVFADVAAGIFKVLNVILDFIITGFTQGWGKAWEGLKTTLGGVFESLKEIVKKPLNFIIDMVNQAIDGINSLKVPDWVPGIGGQSAGIPHIPKLAKGGITNGEMLATIGDNPGGREVVSPLSTLNDMMASTVSNAVVTAMAFGGGQSTQQQGDIVLQLDGRTLARMVKPYLDNENKRVGTNVRLTNI